MTRHLPSFGFACLASLAVSTLATAAVCDGVSTTANTTLRSAVVVTGLTGRPLYVTSPPGDTNRLFIVEQSGFIRIHKRGDPTTTTTLYLDLSGIVQANTSLNEMGLLGMAFDPDYATNGRFYVNYTEGPLAGPWFSVVAQYTVSGGNPDQANAASEVRLMRFGQPQSNHNGGHMMFGPDGFLYISTGDGGGSGDPHGTCGSGQNLASVLGKMLRIDVRGIDPTATNPDCSAAPGATYKVPDNPFSDGSGGNCDEIFEYGLRNPWRSSYDAVTGDLYVADVGQNCWEEVNYVPAASVGGQNFGWRQMEANHCFNTAQQSNCNPPAQSCGSSPACNDPGLTDPVVEYGHGGTPFACSITGGYVYRGCRMSNFLGTYFYGDYCAGWIKSFVISGGLPTSPGDWTLGIDPSFALRNGLTSFGTDAQGEMFITDNAGTQQILKIVPPFPDLEVSGTGAGMFLLDKTGDWTWENLFRSTEIPLTFYRVYRGTPNGNFSCVLKTANPLWAAGGDPSNPAPGQLFAYVVTAINAAAEETQKGHPGTFSAAGCP